MSFETSTPLPSVDATTFDKTVLETSSEIPVVVLFHAKWHPPSRQMMDVIQAMQSEYGEAVKFCVVHVDSNEKLVKKEGISAYPTTAFHRFGHVVKLVQGADPLRVLDGIKEVLAMKELPPDSSTRNQSHLSDEEKDRLHKLVASANVMLFMKGVKEKPFCRFSKEAVRILNDMEVEYESFDVFEDRSVRDGLKLLFDWPTFPQLYVKGEFVGGVDIMQEMAQDGTLLQHFKEAGATKGDTSAAVTRGPLAKSQSQKFTVEPALQERLYKLVRTKEIMLFMKGSPEHPQCGFSKQIVEILQLAHIAFGHFDILGDSDVREGLKSQYDWPTFPQLFAHGHFIGGLDVVKEIVADGGPGSLLKEIEACKDQT